MMLYRIDRLYDRVKLVDFDSSAKFNRDGKYDVYVSACCYSRVPI